ncbi:MAG: hypothetical protein DI616_15825 [Paracoccus denitrificans]|uniref:Uncharacterized protein n=1 Tax=Paracoccus denitrificans TaxID=266 RepID=A0A533I361_PARDE|nr:MAG: hypothetical protein DI616_15825 [Paracoccus denitrificans]
MTGITACWIRHIPTGKVIAGKTTREIHYGWLFDFYAPYRSSPEHEILLHYAEDPPNHSYWFNGSQERWIKCNWDCPVPEALEMQILCGAI